MGGTVLVRGVSEDPEKRRHWQKPVSREDGAEGQWVGARSHAKLQSGGETTGHHPGPGQQFLVRWSHSIGQRLPGKEEELTFAGEQRPGVTGVSQIEDRKAARPHFADDKAEATWLRRNLKPVDLLHSPASPEPTKQECQLSIPDTQLICTREPGPLQGPGGMRRS